jgi:hypothetical protein
MAWLRLGDNAATYPALLECGEHPDADDDTVDVVFGWFIRVAAQAALHPHVSEYIVSMATARLIAGTRQRLEVRIKFASYGGLVTEIVVDGRPSLRLINDVKFVHLKTQEVLDWEDQQRRDNSNKHVTLLVRIRDGDACRYCQKIVFWADRRGAKGGTYDHRPPGRPASADTSVVACGACNSGRGGIAKAFPKEDADAALAAADEVYPLLLVPDEPYFSPASRAWLHKHETILGQYGIVPPPLADPDELPLEPGTPMPGAARATPSGVGAGPATGKRSGAARATPSGVGAGPATGKRSGAARATPPGAGAGPATAKRSGAARATPPGVGAGPATAEVPDLAPISRSQQIGSLQNPDTPGRVGSGRVGSRSGLAGAGGAGTGLAPQVPPDGGDGARRRGRRGGRR